MRPATITTDIGLRCPRCEYNLTGLVEPRCPECGAAFDWDFVRRAAANPPQIGFEKARGWGKLPGFMVTWLAVLFAPWVFARQIVARVDGRHALAFAAVCFVSTLVSFLFGADVPLVLAWLTTAAIYIVLQTIGLSLLDPAPWRRSVVSRWRALGASTRFWLLVGCYTSAIMVTEFTMGPPLLELEHAWRAPLAPLFRSSSPLGLTGVESWLHWSQLMIWVIEVSAVYSRRVRLHGLAPLLSWPASVAIAMGLLHLYAAVVEHIGVRLYDLFGGL